MRQVPHAFPLTAFVDRFKNQGNHSLEYNNPLNHFLISIATNSPLLETDLGGSSKLSV
jgi:hypothetical protein